MRLEKYKDKKETRKKVMLIGLTVITLVSVAMMLYKTFANFRTTTSFPIMSGKVIYKKKALEFGTDIKEGEGGLYKIDHGGGDLWGQSELRYAGLYPSNYVYFNCKDETTEQSTSNCELWRIIGLVNVNTSGGVTQRIEIIKNDFHLKHKYGYYKYWDQTSYDSLKDEVNVTYYNNSLKDTAKRMVASDIIWSTRGTDDYPTASDGYFEQTRYSSRWMNGYVGLIHVYDFAYAVGGVNREWCYDQNVTYPSATSCTKENWLCKNDNEWTMDANLWQAYEAVNIIDETCIIQPTSIGDMGQNYSFYWRPVVYLASNVKITGGSGSSVDPYTLSLI